MSGEARKIFAAAGFFFLVACSGQKASPADSDMAEYLGQFQNGSLSVDYIAPSGVVGPDAERIVVHFTQPMVSLGQIGQSVREDVAAIVPPVQGRFYWANTRTWIFEPREVFSINQTYKVTVRAGKESLLGRALLSDHVFEFQVKSSLKSRELPYRVSWQQQSPDNEPEPEAPQLPAPQTATRHLLNVILAVEKNVFRPDEDISVQGQVQGGHGMHRVWLKIFSDQDEVKLWLDGILQNQAQKGISTMTTRDQFHFSVRSPNVVGKHSLVAVARSTKGDWGLATFHFTVEAPVTLAFALPEHVGFGDTIEIPVTLTNHTPQPQFCRFQHKTTDFFVAHQGPEKLTLKSLDTVSVPVTIFVQANSSAVPKPDGFMAELELSCLAEKFTALARHETAVFYPFTVKHEKSFGLLELSRRVPIRKKPDWQPDFGGVYLYFGANPDLVAGRWGPMLPQDMPLASEDRPPTVTVQLNQQDILNLSLDPFRDHDEIFLPMDKLPAEMDFQMTKTAPGWLFYLADVVYAKRPILGGEENGATLTWAWQEGGHGVRLGLFLERHEEQLNIVFPLPAGAQVTFVEMPWPLIVLTKGLSEPVKGDGTLSTLVKNDGRLIFSLPHLSRGYHEIALQLEPQFAGRVGVGPVVLMKKKDARVLAKIFPPASTMR